MNPKTRSFAAISLIGFVPTFSILFTLVYNDDELTSQIFFMACKLWIFIVPTYWFLKVEGRHVSWSKPHREGIIMGIVTGSVMTVIILVMWGIFGATIDTQSLVSEIDNTGLTDVRVYIAGMIYWIFINSLLEEYVFRWFITTQGIKLLGSDKGGIILSACMFTLHHSIALHFFGFIWWQTIIASFGLLSAAAIWSWLYVRHKSIWVCWISHAICDVAVFGIGYLIIFA